MSGTRNPYVILGVHFGATRDAASAAFAAQARGLRRAPNGADRLRDLTWALNQVEEVLRAPRLSLDVYRVPADPRPFEPMGPGVLSPRPEGMARRTGESTSEVARLVAEATQEALVTLRAELAARSSLPAR